MTDRAAHRLPLRLPLWLALCANVAAAAPPAATTKSKNSDNARAVAARITGAALLGGGAFHIVKSLTDEVGTRFAGTPGADRAVAWALEKMKSVGLRNVHKETVKVPRWVRGAESAEVLAPSPHPLHAAALGGSVGTPEAGVTAEVVEVASFEELKALGEARVKGRIVFFNKPMERTKTFAGYAAAVPIRGKGAVEAARLGAAAALMRSVGTGLHQLPHTGATRYDDTVIKIPFAAVSAEDAELLHRLLAGGAAVRVRLRLGAQLLPEAESANVVGEIPGRGPGDEIVLLGAHLDSWDLGEGAIDDGAGCAIVLETARILTTLGITPRRTVRVVLFMNEEFGLTGAKAYAEAHAAELPRHAAAIEADAGAGRPTGFSVAGPQASVDLLRALAAPLAALGADGVHPSEGAGADLIPVQAKGVPVLGMVQDVSEYFDWHHTAGDTLDKIDPRDLAHAAAAFAVVAHALADTPDRLPPSPPPRRF